MKVFFKHNCSEEVFVGDGVTIENGHLLGRFHYLLTGSLQTKIFLDDCLQEFVEKHHGYKGIAREGEQIFLQVRVVNLGFDDLD
jgi:hypothetical protein